MKIKTYVVGSATHYSNFIENVELVPTIQEANLVIFTGGEDVHPSFYGNADNSRCYANIARDQYEQKMFQQIDHNSQLSIGICRGSQFLCVMNGGLLVQDCNNHGLYNTHEIILNDELTEITSTHHQMMFPYNLPKDEYILMGYSPINRSKLHYGVDWKDEYKECEIVYFKKYNCFCVQGHPEYMGECDVVTKLNQIIKSFLK